MSTQQKKTIWCLALAISLFAGNCLAFQIFVKILQGITSAEPVIKLMYFEDIDSVTSWEEEILFEEDYEFTFISTFNGSTQVGQGTWTQTNNIITCFQNGVPQLEYYLEGSTIILSGLTATHKYELHFVKKTQ